MHTNVHSQFLDFVNYDYLSILSESTQVIDVEDSKSTSKQSSSQSIASEKSSSTSLKYVWIFESAFWNVYSALLPDIHWLSTLLINYSSFTNFLRKSSSSNGVKSSTSLTTKKSSSSITSNDNGVKSKSESRYNSRVTMERL